MAKARILAVDDQRYFRVYLEDLLAQQGFEVNTAASGEEALHLMEGALYDVVVTDLVMPGLAGVELVERVKARWPDQDVVVVTSVGDVRTAVEAMRSGASDYLLKPLDATLLARSLEAILQRKRLRQEHASLMAENLEYLGVLSLYERTMALFSTLAVEPLADRIVEGLCLEARAQGGIAWLARPGDPARLRLAAARGLVRVDREPEEVSIEALPPDLEPLLRPDAAPFAVGASLVVPLRHEARVVGFARLTDKLSGGPFDDRDRIVTERFATPAAIAVTNALRFRALEHRSFRDPVTKAYTWAFFEDVVRNEIRKAGRFGRAFSLLKVELAGVATLRRELSDSEFAAWQERLAFQVGRVLRTTDLLAAENDSRFAVLLPETDALGAAVLKRRIGEVLERGELLRAGAEREAPRLHLAAASFPVDGGQLEELDRVLATRLAQDRDSLVHALGLEHKPFPILLDALAGRGEPLGADALDQVLRFVLAEVERRAGERGLLCLSPGTALLPVAREGLARLDPAHTRTELVVVTDGRADALAGVPVTSVQPQQIGTHRPFLLYYAEGPAYALVGEPGAIGGSLFQTSDRVLVEHLAFQLQRALGVPIAR